MPCRGPQKGQISLFQKRDRPLSEARNGYCNGSAAGRRRWRQHSLRLYGIRRPFGRQAVVDRGRHFHALCPPALCHRFLSASCSAGKPAESGTAMRYLCAARGAGGPGFCRGTFGCSGEKNAQRGDAGFALYLPEAGHGSAPGRADGLLCIAGRACRQRIACSRRRGKRGKAWRCPRIGQDHGSRHAGNKKRGASRVPFRQRPQGSVYGGAVSTAGPSNGISPAGVRQAGGAVSAFPAPVRDTPSLWAAGCGGQGAGISMSYAPRACALCNFCP